MSPDPAAPVDLSFGDAYDRLQQVAGELGADATMAPDRLIALLREGKGLERALRDHLERVEQEVRAIEDGDGAVPFRIVGAAPAAPPAPPAPAAPPVPAAPAASLATEAASPAPAASATVAEPVAPSVPEAAPRRTPPTPEAPPAPEPELPPAAPTLGFVDDDIPF